MIKKLFSLTAALIIATSFCTAESLEAHVLRLNQRNGSMIADYTETKVMPKLKKKTVKKGTLHFKNEGQRLIMRYADPKGDYTLIKDGVMTVKKGTETQKFKGSNKDSQMTLLKNSLLNALQGNVEAIAKDNKASIQGTESAVRYKFVITRKIEQKQGVNSLTLLYDKATGALISLKLEQANGNYTIYETVEPDVKTVFDDSVFEIK